MLGTMRGWSWAGASLLIGLASLAALPVALANPTPNTIRRYGGPRLEVVHRITTGIQPKSVSVSPDGRHVYVCNFGTRDHDNVYVYDAETLERVAQVDFPGNAVETAFSVDGSQVYVSNFRRGVIEVIDRENHQVIRELPAGRAPKTMLPSPDGRYLYVANWTGNSLSIIDLEDPARSREIPVGIHPRGMTLTPSGELWVAAMYDHEIHRFNAEGERIGRSLPTCRFPRHLAFHQPSERVVVSCSSNRSIRWHDPVSGGLLQIAGVGENPRTLAISGDGRYLATADFDSSTISVVDTVEGRRRINEVRGADRFVGVAFHPQEMRIYATSWNNQRLFVLEPRPVTP